MFYVVDRINFTRAPRPVREQETASETWRLDGLPNLFFLAVILGAVFVTRPVFVREALMVVAAIASYFTSPKSIHAANDFNFRPMREVAVLFAGIFATMMPALDWLSQNASAVASNAAYALTIYGRNFTAASTVQCNATALAATYVNTTQMTVAVPANLFTSAGVASVTISNMTGTSSSATITINPALAVITSLSPNSGYLLSPPSRPAFHKTSDIDKTNIKTAIPPIPFIRSII